MTMRILVIYTLFLVFTLPAKAEEPKETVVLLHGIARTSNSLSKVKIKLQEQGYDTLAITYPSTDKNIDGIVEHLYKKHLTKEFWQNAEKVHFVTHSMGGLVVRRYLETHKQTKLGRVVMLGPPNGGSEVANVLNNLKPYQWFYGPAGEELTTKSREKDKTKPYYEVGIIAGTKEWPYFVAAFVVPGKSDGRVSVENTKLDGMKDHIEIPATHTFIMDRPDVHRQILRFLKQGEFEHKTQ